ncbi:nmrA-like family domain-containing protein 1 [Colletotrichum liriopes]|uniref:NmrA-like family domain-containing protein 1 n=1 Tax=Colletotrichum liriopes TaxID=708192 RepID=A0AA37LRK5_9PEZI|nr:nmrA-like family domain-containing protein 1 [Colletotrichum liriopes]
MSLVVVLGATGQQGGSVVSALLQNPLFRIRAVTRNPASASAKKLVEKGIEVVAANIEDEESLVRAFDGASAIFATTAFWDTFPKVGLEGASHEEAEQQKKIARSAAKISTLKHFVISSLPPANEVSNGKLSVLHFDSKHVAYKWMEKNLPELTAKTTRLWLGWYSSNMADYPLIKVTPIPMSETSVWIQPGKKDDVIPIGGNVQYNTGVMVEAILKSGPLAYGKIAILVTEYLTFEQALDSWKRATKKNAIYVPCTYEQYETLWGPYGTEIGSQYRWSEDHPNWHALFPGKVISHDELGVTGKLIGHEETLVSLKERLM